MGKTGQNALHVLSTNIPAMLMATRKFIDSVKYPGTTIELFSNAIFICARTTNANSAGIKI